MRQDGAIGENRRITGDKCPISDHRHEGQSVTMARESNFTASYKTPEGRLETISHVGGGFSRHERQ